MQVKLAASEISDLDPYKFMAVIGKQVIHPGGRMSTQALQPGHHEPVAGRPAYMRKMGWPMPRMAKAVPCLGYILVTGSKPLDPSWP